MRDARLLLAIVTALAVGACARQQQTYYVVDPSTGQPVPVVTQQQYAQQQYAQQGYVQQPQYAQSAYPQPAVQPRAASSNSRALYSSSPAYAQQSYAQPSYQQPAALPQANGGGRGLLTSQVFTQTYSQPGYVQQQPSVQPPSVIQYSAPQPAPVAQGGPYAAAPYGYASAPANTQQAYTLDSGDKLRVVVFGQDGISSSYTVDAGGNVNLPLIGAVPARGYSTQQLSQMITERLKQGFVREPHVSVEIEAYRPFFILGEVTTPGQYPYVANMTVETAIAIAGGFAPRASKSKVEITRNAPGQQFHGEVPLTFMLRPGDTVVVKERWF